MTRFGFIMPSTQFSDKSVSQYVSQVQLDLEVMKNAITKSGLLSAVADVCTIQCNLKMLHDHLLKQHRIYISINLQFPKGKFQT